MRYNARKDSLEVRVEQHVAQPAAYYDAFEDDSTITVKIPQGGSLSGASLVYFGDPHRWMKDWRAQQNMYIHNPDEVYPGDVFTFVK
jgi:nucleoid-associated protein YgaU